MGQKKIQAVLFDLGDTLINFGKVDTVKLFKQGSRLGYEFLKSTNQPTGNYRWFMVKHLVMVRLYHIWSNIIGRDFDSTKILRKIAQTADSDLTDEQWDEFAWCWYEPLSKMAVIEDDTKQTLSKLTKMGLKIGIVSNTFINAVTLDRHLEQLGLADCFDVKLYSYQFPYRKPNSKIFIDAAEQINVSPENIVFIGDRLDTDVVGSQRVGMVSVLKKAYTNAKKKIPTGVIKIDTIAKLPNIIEKINSSDFEVVHAG